MSQSENAKITIESLDTPEGMLMTLKGIVDEDTTFNCIPADQSKRLIFDLSGVSLINSMGIRNWVNWMKANKDRSMIFRSCSKAIIDQVNALDGFLPAGAIVESFFVPYHCDNCGNSARTLFRKGHEFEMGTADAKPQIRPPQQKCPKCQNAMEMDVIESKYFRFLRYR